MDKILCCMHCHLKKTNQACNRVIKECAVRFENDGYPTFLLTREQLSEGETNLDLLSPFVL